ncbi:hypothetical protein F53441_14470, partial [Fusarium austroafricanum]
MNAQHPGTPPGSPPGGNGNNGNNIPQPVLTRNMVTIYFGPGGSHGIERVSSAIIGITQPEFLRRFTPWGVLQLPAAPPEVRTAFISYLYTGQIRFPELDATSSQDDLADVLEVTVHMYSQGEANNMQNLMNQAISILEYLHEFVPYTRMLLYVLDVIEYFYPNITYGWIRAQAALETIEFHNQLLSLASEAQLEAEETSSDVTMLNGDEEHSGELGDSNDEQGVEQDVEQ